jgi:predicted kinase
VADAEVAENEHMRDKRSGSDLDQRLARLPDGHPSAAKYADGARRPVPDQGFEADEGPERIGPLTDAEHSEHVADVAARLRLARDAGLTTDRSHTIDPGREFWSADREVAHDQIVSDFYDRAKDVPCEFQAIVAGGLAGAGKTTVLREHAGIDPARYLVINPDAIKEELARRNLVPAVDGLSPMEASNLAHEESSHLAKRLALRAQAEGRNVIWDITMSSGASTGGRLDLLRAAGYTRIEGIFVDIPTDVSLRRADARHRAGHDDFRAGTGLGGRFVPEEMIAAQFDGEWGSKNRRNFEQVKHRFDAWSCFDNSVDGRTPILAERGIAPEEGD